jgi:hypothetical protein
MSNKCFLTLTGTQKAAEADHWELTEELNYDDVAKKHNVIFDNAPPTTKLMIGRPDK